MVAKRSIGGALEYAHPDLYKFAPGTRILQDVTVMMPPLPPPPPP